MANKINTNVLPELARWLSKATPAQKKEMFRLAGTSLAMARQYLTERRTVSAKIAAGIEEATQTMAALFDDAPEPLKRGDLNSTCGKCPYYKEAQGCGK